MAAPSIGSQASGRCLRTTAMVTMRKPTTSAKWTKAAKPPASDMKRVSPLLMPGEYARLDFPCQVDHKSAPCFQKGGNLELKCRVPRGANRRCDVPKMKTNKSAAKRFKISGKGRVRRPKAGGNHLLQEKSRKRLRRLRKNDMVDSTFE